MEDLEVHKTIFLNIKGKIVSLTKGKTISDHQLGINKIKFQLGWGSSWFGTSKSYGLDYKVPEGVACHGYYENSGVE